MGHNQWLSAKLDYIPNRVDSVYHQYAAFFTCECQDGYINQRTYGENQTAMWFLRGSVCVENKFRNNRIFEQGMRGAVAMACFLFIVMVTMIVICVKTRKRRNPVRCCGKELSKCR